MERKAGVGDEFALIERLTERLAAGGAQPAAGSIPLSIGDDGAVLAPPAGHQVVVTVDALVEEVHFRRDWSKAEDVGWKALAVNVSDLGAMGARPLAAFITLALPRDLPRRWIERFYDGLGECATAYVCPIAGGDTVRSPDRISISITALGSAPAGRFVSRARAQVGDDIWVTGVLGDSGAGLALLQKGRVPKRFEAVAAWHRRPHPPVLAGVALAEAGLATAMLDLSDGLASDLRHIAKRSGVGLRIDADRLPISDAARQAGKSLGIEPLHWALHGGEDYQLLFTATADRRGEAPPLLAPLGIAPVRIGTVVKRGITLVQDGKAEALKPLGFSHFG